MELTNDQKKFFSEKFLEKYLGNGFGTMTKAEIDVLVYHLISDSDALSGKSNYDIANKLRITEAKVKNLRLNAALRHNQANHKKVLRGVVSRIIDKIQSPDFVEGRVEITIENPVEKREIEHAVKTAGRSIEYGLNKEILKISPLSLFELVMSTVEDGERRFREIVQDQIKDREARNNILNDALTFRQKINKLGEELNDKAGLVGLLSAAGSAL